MASSISRRIRIWFYLSDFHRQQDGKLTLVASIMMLAIIVLIGLVGNVGHAVHEKMEVQNAADATAFSSALWMARGMNALTATNHMLGETTGLTVVHEALGGPGADLNIRENTTENQTIDRMIGTPIGTRDTAPIGELVPPASVYVPAPVHRIDKAIVDFVTNRTTPKSGSRDFAAFATIYESKMTLKRELNIQLIAKSFADLGFYAPPPISWGTVPAAYVAHIYSSSQLVLIAKEWVILDVLEKVAALPAFKKIKREVIEAQLIPMLVAHADFVASYDPQSGEFEAGILNSAVERTIQELQDRHSAELAIFPVAEDLRLPVQPEPKPNLNGGPNVAGWGNDDPVLPDLSIIDDLISKTSSTLRKIRARKTSIQSELDELDEYEQEIDDRLEESDIPAAERSELQNEKNAIAASRRQLEDDLEELEEAEREILEADAQLPQPGDEPPRSSHPSVKRLPQRMDQAQERYTQWVRASHPYTDSFRAPILAMFRRHLKKSQAAKHFEKWTNRYTMVKAWQFRSGYRITKTGAASTTWQKKEDSLHMHVLRDSFDGERSRKGSEDWTRSSDQGKATAEQYFTLLGFAHRDFQPLFASVVYPAASNRGITCYAQAIFYNANPQQPANGGEFQSKIGWDTLNWDPGNPVPEWGGPATDASAKWPWDVFSSGQHRTKVKLNWQPKLMPVTQSRLDECLPELKGDVADNVEHAAEYFEALGTH